MPASSNNKNPLTPGPLVREVTCIAVRCSGCGREPASDDEGYNPHFASRDQAREILAEICEWRITGDQRLCRGCGEKAEGDRLGHLPVTLGPTLLADGRTLGATTWCDRCGNLLSPCPAAHPGTEGYPAPGPHHGSLHWDAAAFPQEQAIAEAAIVVLTSLSAAAVTARWHAWPGNQIRRLQLQQPSLNARQAAARLLAAAAVRLPAAGAPASGGNPGAWAAFVHDVRFQPGKADSHLSALRPAAELGGHDIARLRQWVHGDARQAEAILKLHGQHEAAALLAGLRSRTAEPQVIASIRLTMSLALESAG